LPEQLLKPSKSQSYANHTPSIRQANTVIQVEAFHTMKGDVENTQICLLQRALHKLDNALESFGAVINARD